MNENDLVIQKKYRPVKGLAASGNFLTEELFERYKATSNIVNSKVFEKGIAYVLHLNDCTLKGSLNSGEEKLKICGRKSKVSETKFLLEKNFNGWNLEEIIQQPRYYDNAPTL